MSFATRVAFASLAASVLAGSLLAGAVPVRTEAVDLVDPNIGGVGHLLQPTLPLVQLPHGMVRLAPLTTSGLVDRYLADKIYGFPAGGVSFLPTSGPLMTVPAQYASDYDHDFETVTPYYCSETLDSYGIQVEYTAARRAAYYRLTYPGGEPAHVVFHSGPNGRVSQDGNRALAGDGVNDGVRSYFYAELSAAVSDMKPWSGPSPADSGVSFDLAAASPRVEMRVGISFISAEQARRNLQTDLPRWNFEEARAAARTEWSRALGRIAVQGGTLRERRIFYTSLYRSMGRMIDITEAGGVYMGFDGRPHEAGGHPFYTDDGLWDTYRSLHPLQLLLDGNRQADMIRSYLRMYEQSGWLPSFPTVGTERAFMIGHHAAPFILDTYRKGYRDFDVAEAYQAMRKNATEATMLPWRRGPATLLDRVYYEKGFFPALSPGEKEFMPEVHPSERRQAVAVTLENAYDDWAVAELAKELHKDADYALFSRRARNYANVFNRETGFMSPKTAGGEWAPRFDPKLGGGQGGRDYFAECNSWVYSFHVQHDIAGLIELMGGREAFAARLDRLFEEPFGVSKWDFLKQFPDATGLIGQYAQGDEPSFHIPYLYNYAGQPWKTQRRIRQILHVWYGDGPLGVIGDEDGGAMSSWYVLSAMGFYPVAPGRPIYDIGSPLFEQVRITMGNGKVFSIVAKGASARNKYVQSVTLNNRKLDGPWFRHSDIAAGGTLILVMGSRPNTTWGTAAASHPPDLD